MRLFFAGITLLIASLTAGCAYRDSTLVDMTPVIAGKPIVMSEVQLWKSRGVDLALAKGVYTPTQENSAGVLYEGPPHCTAYKTLNGSFVLTSGGVWVPRDTNLPMWEWHYASYDQLSVPNHEAMLAAMSGGLLQPQSESRAKQTTSVQNLPSISATSATTGAGAGLGIGIVEAIAARDAEKMSGSPFLGWKLDASVAAKINAQIGR